MSNLFFYEVHGFKKYDKVTDTYIEVRKIEVIAKTEEEALERAEKALKCNNYMVMACYERVMPYESNHELVEAILDIARSIRYTKDSNATGGKP